MAYHCPTCEEQAQKAFGERLIVAAIHNVAFNREPELLVNLDRAVAQMSLGMQLALRQAGALYPEPH